MSRYQLLVGRNDQLGQQMHADVDAMWVATRAGVEPSVRTSLPDDGPAEYIASHYYTGMEKLVNPTSYCSHVYGVPRLHANTKR